MYTSKNFQIRDEETFSLCIPTDRDYKILQLTDLHLGFGMFSGKKDKLALEAVAELIHRTEPDLMVLTGDSVFPFFPKSGTMNNRKQAEKLLAFLDGFQIPYTLVFGNHDCEMGSTCNKEQLAEIFTTGKYAVFTKGRYEHSPQNPITGVGNFVVDLTDDQGKLLLPLILLDSIGWDDAGVCILLVIVAIATLLLLTFRDNKKEKKATEEKKATQTSTSNSGLEKSIKKLMRTVALVLFFLVSFATGAWVVTWLIFPIEKALEGVVCAALDLKGED